MEYPEGIVVPSGPDAHSLKETIIKAARYVKENGTALEEKLQMDPRFSFVHPENEYHDFYRYILNNQQPLSGIVETDGSAEDHFNEEKHRKPKEPYPLSFMNYDKKLTQRDLEIIKLAAAFCVVNEDVNYLEKMQKRFDGDQLFEFLKPEHALNNTFIQFMNQYKQVQNNVLDPPFFEVKNKDYKFKILERAFERAEFVEYSKELKNVRDRALHIQKVQFAAFDWTDFKVMDTVVLPTSDEVDLPEPLEFSQLALKRLGTTDAVEIFKKVREKRQQVTKKSEEKTKKRKIRAAGETRLKMRNTARDKSDQASVKYIKCPISHKMIPEEKFDRHLQVLLVDPHYKMEREQYEAKHRLSNLTSSEVYENIKRIARHSAK